MYKLKDEPRLLFDLLWAMDGNDSLKRILQRLLSIDGGLGIPGSSCEQTDTRHVVGDMYISREDVNKWSREVVTQVKVACEGVSFISIFHYTYLADMQHAGS